MSARKLVWSLGILALLFGAVAPVMAESSQLTSAEIDATIAALEQQKAQLEESKDSPSTSGQVAMIPSNGESSSVGLVDATASGRFPSVGLDGLPLRQPTEAEAADLAYKDGSTWQDCFAAVDEHNPEHRFAFVGICEAGADQLLNLMLCQRQDNALPQTLGLYSYQLQSNSPSLWKEGWDEIGKLGGVGFSALEERYSARLETEWQSGDIPAGVPFESPDMLEVVTRIGCWAPPA